MDKRFFCAVKAFVYSDQKFLIVKRSLQARGDAYSWEFPGGRLEFGESPEVSVVREVKEETSLQVDCLCPLSTWTFMKDGSTQVVGITFLCIPRSAGTVVLSREHDEFAWIGKSETGSFQFSKGIAEEISQLDWELVKNQASSKASDTIVG